MGVRIMTYTPIIKHSFYLMINTLKNLPYLIS